MSKEQKQRSRITRRAPRAPRPSESLILRWRKLAEEGYLYSEIRRLYPEHSQHQIRHYCLGNVGKHVAGPIQQADRWYGSNVWLRGERSPHAQLSEKQARMVLKSSESGAKLAKRLGVSSSTIYMLRRGETWKHLHAELDPKARNVRS